MSTSVWTRGPIGLDAAARVTMTGCRMVLVMVPTLTAGTRLLELIPLLESDHRVQMVFTVPQTDDTWQGLEDFVRCLGGLALPWSQARRHRWDLVLSASHRHVEMVHGPLLILPHGAGSMGSRRFSRKAGNATCPTTGLDRELLTYRGRVIPAALGLTHEDELAALGRTCPEAVPVAFIAGDLCLDRMVVSIRFRDQYRTALGVRPDQQLVTVSSTWSSDALFNRHTDLYRRLVEELPRDGFRVAAVLHPNVWMVHSAWQVRTWLASARRGGLLVIPPEIGWQATMIASDHVIGDHGSTTSYAAAAGVPVRLVGKSNAAIRHGGIAHRMASRCGLLDLGSPFAEQLGAPRNDLGTDLVDVLSSVPGEAAQRFRAAMYRLLNLPEPSWPASTQPYSLPSAMADSWGWR